MTDYLRNIACYNIKNSNLESMVIDKQCGHLYVRLYIFLKSNVFEKLLLTQNILPPIVNRLFKIENPKLVSMVIGKQYGHSHVQSPVFLKLNVFEKLLMNQTTNHPTIVGWIFSNMMEYYD